MTTDRDLRAAVEALADEYVRRADTYRNSHLVQRARDLRRHAHDLRAILAEHPAAPVENADRGTRDVDRVAQVGEHRGRRKFEGTPSQAVSEAAGSSPAPVNPTSPAEHPATSGEPVHNHPPYRPPCNERVVDGRLRGACLSDLATPPAEPDAGGEGLTADEVASLRYAAGMILSGSWNWEDSDVAHEVADGLVRALDALADRERVLRDRIAEVEAERDLERWKYEQERKGAHFYADRAAERGERLAAVEAAWAEYRGNLGASIPPYYRDRIDAALGDRIEGGDA